VQIREAARGGFLAGDGEKELEKFWNLMQKTSGRDGFTPHNKNYYAQLLHIAPDKFKLFFAVLEDKTIAAGIFSFFGNMATYLFGASDDEYREVMAPHLLQWEIIKRAKAGGYKYYDFFGIDEKKWPGVTRFKRGFAGQEINYTGTFDVIFDKQKYLAYKIFRRLRRFF
ncbi:MAG TPA: peptidoglycan bridge formation glycyltransferase FemA/FemB family protein, partial [Candidatus Methylomirabilis sp.]|nr:peptidoglycan bridge formation glycyltransferase FemA/FemB family protein [Candidatus Methylomirabilis sp.]